MLRLALVLYCTVTCWLLAGLNVTVNVRFGKSPLFPSVTLGELIDSVCAAGLGRDGDQGDEQQGEKVEAPAGDPPLHANVRVIMPLSPSDTLGELMDSVGARDADSRSLRYGDGERQRRHVVFGVGRFPGIGARFAVTAVGVPAMVRVAGGPGQARRHGRWCARVAQGSLVGRPRGRTRGATGTNVPFDPVAITPFSAIEADDRGKHASHLYPPPPPPPTPHNPSSFGPEGRQAP